MKLNSIETALTLFSFFCEIVKLFSLNLDPQIKLNGDPYVKIEACSVPEWEDPGVRVEGIPKSKRASIELTQEWDDPGPIDLTHPGIYHSSYKVCTNDRCSIPVTRDIEVVKKLGPQIHVEGEKNFHIIWRGKGEDINLEVSASDACIPDKLPLCSKCKVEECRSTCVSFHAQAVKFEDFSAFSDLEINVGPIISAEKTQKDRLTYYCGSEDESSHVAAARRANEKQDLSLLSSACGVYDVMFTANDYVGNLGFKHSNFLTMDEMVKPLNAKIPTKPEEWKPRHPKYLGHSDFVKYGIITGSGSLFIIVILSAGSVVYRMSKKHRADSSEDDEDEYLLI